MDRSRPAESNYSTGCPNINMSVNRAPTIAVNMSWKMSGKRKELFAE